MAINTFFPCNYRYPYTNDHELNLGWVLATIKAQESELSKFVALNTVKYADPFDWNITSQYATNTVVFNPADMTAYISVQPVPSGVQIDNTEYWTPIFTLADIFTAYKTSITPVEQIAAKPATQAISKGQLLWIDNVLYQAVRDIAQGTVIVPGENVLLTNISDELAAQEAAITAEQDTRVRADTQLQANITAERSAREQSDQLLQTNITAEQTAREQADQLLQNQINTLKTANIPLFIGDSYALGYGDSTPAKYTGWPAILAGFMNAQSIYTSISTGGCGFCNTGNNGKTFLGLLQSYTGNKNNVNMVVVCGGYNDNGFSIEAITQAVSDFCSYAKQNFPNAKIYVGMIANNGAISNHNIRLSIANNVLPAYNSCTNVGAIYLDGVESVLKNYDFISSDNIHPNQNGYNAIAGAIYAAIYGGFSAKSGFNSAAYSPNGTANNPTIGTVQNGTEVFFYFSNLILNTPTFNITTGIRELYLGTISFKNFRPVLDENVSLCTVQGYIQTTENAQYTIYGYLVLSNTGTIQVEIYSIDNGSVLQINNVNYINIAPFQFKMPAKYC